jgi:soluble lytic murein transglycosylase
VVVVGVLVLARVAAADIYFYRDRFGVLHFTNASAEQGRLVIKEYPLPPGPRMLSTTPPRAGAAGERAYDTLIREIAGRHGVEYALVKAVIKAESAFNRHAVSRKGALGLMQLMPATAAMHQVRNAFLPRDNIEGGVRHLRMLLNRYGGNLPLAVAAYNAGTQRVEDAGGVPRIQETREYLARVLRYRVAYLREDTGVQARR